MVIHTAYRLELDPNDVQAFCLQLGPGPNLCPPCQTNQFTLMNAWNQCKHTGAPWYTSVSKFCFEEAFEDCTRAFKNFFRDPKKFKYPNFARKFINDRVRLRSVSLHGRYLHLPKIGEVRYKNKPLVLPVGAKALSVTVGIDLGLTTFATIGSQSGAIERIEAPKPLKKARKSWKFEISPTNR